MDKEYIDYIESGFELFDKIENECISFSKMSDSYSDIKYMNNILVIDVECRNKKIETTITIERSEIARIVLSESVEPREAICRLLREKICMNAHDIK